MGEKIYSKDEVNFKDFSSFYYSDFVNKTVVMYIESNLTKKSFRTFKQNLLNNSFYPLYVIRVRKLDDDITRQAKLNFEKKHYPAKKLFLTRYYEQITKEFNFKCSDNALFLILTQNIKVCPFCKNDKFNILYIPIKLTIITKTFDQFQILRK